MCARIFLIPGILANAGGIIVSYFEQVQNQMNYYWTEEDVRSKLQSTIVKAFEDVYAISEEYKVNMRVVAYMKTLKRGSDAMIVRSQNPSFQNKQSTCAYRTSTKDTEVTLT